MIGFDFISLSSYTHRNLGRKAHRAMLGKMDISGVQLDPILIIEDMDLSIKRRKFLIFLSNIVRT